MREAVQRETPVPSACNDSSLQQTPHRHTEGPVPASVPESPVSDDCECRGTPVIGRSVDHQRPVDKD